MKIRTLTLRLPEPVLDQLYQLADREHRSLNSQIIHLITEASQQGTPNKEGSD